MRRVLRTPGFSISVVLILSVGVAAATAMGSVLYALALKPLSLPDPATLVAVSSIDQRATPRITPLPTVDQLRAAPLVADGWCAYNSIIEATESGGRVMEAYGELLSGDCLAVIGIAPALGRWFTNDEMPLTGSGQPVIVISDRYWKRMFERSPDVLGRTVRMQNVNATVIGVMPESYQGFSRDLSSDFIVPFNAHRPASGGYMYLGRLRPGVTVEQLRSQVRALWPSLLAAVLPASPTRAQTLAEWSADAQLIPGGFSTMRRLYAEPVRRLAVLTIALLALVCVNVGGLMVSRFTSRLHEISAMRAIGATTMRIVYPLAAESVILAVSGTALGVPLAVAASAAFSGLFPTGNMPWTMTTTPEGVVFAAAAVGSLVMALLISALPIWLVARRSPQLRTDRTVSRATSRWAQALLVSQVAVTVTLVFTCGLVVRSFYGLKTVDRGFKSDHLLSLRLAANPGGYKDLDAAAYYNSLVQRLASLPGVHSVGLGRYFGTINAQLPELPIGFVGTAENPASAAMDFVSPGFFATLGVPLLSGRDVQWTDLPPTERVALVSESVSRMLAPDGDVVGRVIRYGTRPEYERLQIVGVVGNISIGNLRKTEERMIYVSSIQVGETTFASAHLRTSGPPMQLAAAASEAVMSMGREHPIGAYPDMLFGNSVVPERMGTAVSSIVALLALIISCIGVFALLSHSVERRTRELGIRMAIGATPGAISRLVMSDALVLVVCGLVVGIPGALGATSLVRSLLYGVTGTDAVTLTVSVVVLLVTALVAALQPTIRAVNVDPATALRAE